VAAIKQCLILAAGNGRRIATVSGNNPKPLVPVRGTPLLEHALLSAQQAGIEKFFVVVGYRGDAIRRWFDSSGFEVPVTCIENVRYQRDNGVSVLQAKGLLHDPFLLLMSDHLFEAQTAERLLHQYISHDEVILAVDRKIHTVFDLEDVMDIVKNHYGAYGIGVEYVYMMVHGAPATKFPEYAVPELAGAHQ
jgi:1L-myo-inositol 1-phosphate cytidylyltransferase